MAPLRRSGFRTARGGSLRRKTDWGVGPCTGTGGSAQAVTSAGTLLATEGVSASIPGLTLVRTRGELLIYLSSVAAPEDGFVGAMGIGVVTDEAFAAGVAAMPTPITDEGSDVWLYHTYFQVIAGGLMSGAAAVDRTSLNPATAVFRRSIDSKAMRKVTVEDTLFATFEFAETGTATMQLHLCTRMLFKLP